MQITRASDYAMRCVMFLASQPPNIVYSRRKVAAAIDAPEPFLGKIAKQLANSGILEVVQGARGGYRLAANPSKLTMLDVVESISGRINLNVCLERPDCCNRQPNCKAHRVWKDVNQNLRRMLGSVTISQLINGDRDK